MDLSKKEESSVEPTMIYIHRCFIFYIFALGDVYETLPGCRPPNVVLLLLLCPALSKEGPSKGSIIPEFFGSSESNHSKLKRSLPFQIEAFPSLPA